MKNCVTYLPVQDRSVRPETDQSRSRERMKRRMKNRLMSAFLYYLACCSFLLASCITSAFAQQPDSVRVLPSFLSNNSAWNEVFTREAIRNMTSADSCLRRGDLIGAQLFTENAILLYTELYGDPSISLAKVYRGAAIVWAERGRPREALTFSDRALAVIKHLPEDIPPGLTGELHLLSARLYRLQGLNMSALDACLQSISAFSNQTPDQLLSLHAEARMMAGRIYYEMQDYALAVEQFEVVRKLVTFFDGPLSQELAVLYNNIGMAYLMADSVEQAIVSLAESATMTYKIFSETSPETAEAYSLLEIAYFKQGIYDSALFYTERVLDIYDRLPTHREGPYQDYLLFQAQRGYQMRAFHSAALWYHRWLDRMLETAPPEGRPAALHNAIAQAEGLASSFIRGGSIRLAVSMYDRALQHCLELYGPHSLKAGILAAEVGKIYEQLGNAEGALRYLEQAILAYEKSGADNTTVLREGWLRVADLQFRQRKYAEALLSYQKVLDSDPGSMTNRKAGVLHTMATTYLQVGMPDSALLLAKQEEAFYTGKYNEQHLRLPECYLLLGNIYSVLLQPEQAFDYYQRAIRLRPALMQEPSERTLQAHLHLADIYARRGRSYEAARHQVQAKQLQEKIRVRVSGATHAP